LIAVERRKNPAALSCACANLKISLPHPWDMPTRQRSFLRRCRRTTLVPGVWHRCCSFAKQKFRGGFSMQKVVRLSATLALCLILGRGAVQAAPVAGMSELQASGGFFHSQGSDSGNLNADLSYGYYFTPGWQVGIRQGLNYNFIDDHRDFWVASTVPFLNYNFRVTDIIVPYLGGFMGLVWNDRDATGTIGPQAGIKFFVHDRAFLNLGYRYEFFFDRLRAIDNNASHGNHVFNIGIGLTWGGGTKSP
jgi:hypothetical protein